LRDPGLAEDATQEIFLRVQRHVNRLPEVSELRPWLFRVARNYCLNEIRNRELRTRTLLSLSHSANQAFDDALVSRSDVQRFLAGLSPRARAVAWLTFVEGMLQKDVATALGLSRRTVVNDLGAVRSHMKAQTSCPRPKRCPAGTAGS
jgi:RNA polymerase sigma-70 factor (ECF subfamily)